MTLVSAPQWFNFESQQSVAANRQLGEQRRSHAKNQTPLKVAASRVYHPPNATEYIAIRGGVRRGRVVPAVIHVDSNLARRRRGIASRKVAEEGVGYPEV